MSEPKPGPVRTSKCRCGPVLFPVDPERPMRWPAPTDCPSFTEMAERWAYWLYLPSLCRMTSSVFGGIAARNSDEGATVLLEERIALGDAGCRVVVELGIARAGADPATHYYATPVEG